MAGTFILFFTTQIAQASGYYNEIKIDGYRIFLDKINKGMLNVKTHNKEVACQISNWKTEYALGGGSISLTTDKKAVLFTNTDSYLYLDDILHCNGKDISLNQVPVPDSSPFGSVIDLNFDKKIYLAVVLEDVRSQRYTAVVSHFGSKKNLIKAVGFTTNQMADSYSSFPLDDAGYGGKISLNGKYIFPTSLNCTEEVFPGVWDIENNKKVVFPARYYTPEEIAVRCEKLFNGQGSLEELGGWLIRPKK